jgi:tetratricopeptide (TPR) repeat protein
MLLLRKVRSFWGAFEIPDSLDYSLYRETAPVLRLPIPGFGLLAPLALVGAALSVRRRGWLRLLLVFGAAYSASVILFFVFSRFRMVLAPALYVFAAHAVVELAQRWRAAARNGRLRAAAIRPTAALALALVVVNVPVRARVDSWSFRLARLVRIPVRSETSALGVFNLGAAYAGRAKAEPGESERFLELAEEQLRRALELQLGSAHARIQVELGKVLARQQRNRDAIAMYRDAARIEPTDYRIHHALGLLYRREGEFEEAAAAFGRGLRLEPRHVAGATELGAALLTLGRIDAAGRAFRHALELSPDNPAAIRGLAALTESR